MPDSAESNHGEKALGKARSGGEALWSTVNSAGPNKDTTA